MSKLSEQEIQEVFDAVEAYRKEHPDVGEALRIYEASRRELQKAWYAEHPHRFSISETTALNAPAIFSYLGQMASHPLLHRATAWILSLYRSAKEQEWTWITPLMPVTEDSELVMEWWHHRKKLCIYVDNEGITFIRVNTSGMITEGDAEDGRAVYEWLISLENIANGTD